MLDFQAMGCYRCDMIPANMQHLVLLIGTNPLPNFVVAEYFLQQPESKIEKIWLIHSTENTIQAGTSDQAANLERVLKGRWAKKYPYIFPLEQIALNDVSNAMQIRHDLSNSKLPKALVDASGFHLNYTGGTKAMSLHVYRSLSEMTQHVQSSFSYLDGRNFRIVGDDDNGIISENLRQTITISLQELIALHGFQRIEKQASVSDDAPISEFPETISAFRQIIAQDQLSGFYSSAGGYQRERFENKQRKLAEKVSQLDKTKIDPCPQTCPQCGYQWPLTEVPYRPNTIFQTILNTLPAEYRLFSEQGQFQWTLSAKKFSTALKFLDGLWLEDYAFTLLHELFQENPFFKGLWENKQLRLQRNWNIQQPGWQGNNFELDVIILYGYQLIVMSCTTDSTKSVCKHKAFEILRRAKQIGGDEAKVIVLTRLDSDTVVILEQELLHDTGAPHHEILVLGMDDLKQQQFDEKITYFLREN